MSAFAWLSAASGAVQAASLNLCTDEYLLLLGRRAEIASVSYLSHDPRESALWQRARQHPANRGSLESALSSRPRLVLTMGGGGRSTALLARRLGIRVLDLPYPSSVQDVGQQAAAVAAALGDVSRAGPFLRSLRELRTTVPARSLDAAYLGQGGLSLHPNSLAAQWMRLAGYAQRKLPGRRVSLEQLAADPPRWLLRSDYRQEQWSRGAAWLQHPLVRRLESRTLRVDGRAWTCAGLPMIAEVRRLKALRP